MSTSPAGQRVSGPLENYYSKMSLDQQTPIKHFLSSMDGVDVKEASPAWPHRLVILVPLPHRAGILNRLSTAFNGAKWGAIICSNPQRPRDEVSAKPRVMDQRRPSTCDAAVPFSTSVTPITDPPSTLNPMRDQRRAPQRGAPPVRALTTADQPPNVPPDGPSSMESLTLPPAGSSCSNIGTAPQSLLTV
jgi:hypothetical protein